MKTVLFWFYYLRSHPMAYWQPRPRRRSPQVRDEAPQQ